MNIAPTDTTNGLVEEQNSWKLSKQSVDVKVLKPVDVEVFECLEMECIGVGNPLDFALEGSFEKGPAFFALAYEAPTFHCDNVGGRVMKIHNINTQPDENLECECMNEVKDMFHRMTRLFDPLFDKKKPTYEAPIFY